MVGEKGREGKDERQDLREMRRVMGGARGLERERWGKIEGGRREREREEV